MIHRVVIQYARYGTGRGMIRGVFVECQWGSSFKEGERCEGRCKVKECIEVCGGRWDYQGLHEGDWKSWIL